MKDAKTEKFQIQEAAKLDAQKRVERAERLRPGKSEPSKTSMELEPEMTGGHDLMDEPMGAPVSLRPPTPVVEEPIEVEDDCPPTELRHGSPLDEDHASGPSARKVWHGSVPRGSVQKDDGAWRPCDRLSVLLRYSRRDELLMVKQVAPTARQWRRPSVRPVSQPAS